MVQSSREVVRRCLKFECPERIPRDLWLLPWAENHYPALVEEIKQRFPPDFCYAPDVYRPSPRVKGDPYAIGEHTDEWGCVFTNVHGGVIGEVKEFLVKNISDSKTIKPPYEILPEEGSSAKEKVNKFCAETEKFVITPCFPRPWERYQFLRGTQNAMMDVMTMEDGVKELLQTIHTFFLKEIEFWISTDVDAIWFMDDWGAQDQLLIPPKVWREIFKPMYKDYCELAHSEGKFALMHSDGCITEIYPDLVEVGVDGINSQLFCMDMPEIARLVKGKITFWGEIDRQHVLPCDELEVGREAVRKVAKHLYDRSGGVIAQFELGPGANPQMAIAIYEEWERIEQDNK
ncbi:MAG: uroporphyrinogen decarboxylase family protein [Planctomycetota bacterium]|jgi:hypothetical protein